MIAQLKKTKLHTQQQANAVITLIRDNIFPDAILIGGFGKGKDTSFHDIDVLINGKKKTQRLKWRLFSLLDAHSVEDTDWGGWYFNDTDFGDVDVFFSMKDLDF